MKRYFLFGLLICSFDAFGVSSFVAEYDLSKGVLKLGEMTRQFSVDDRQRYTFRSTMKTSGLVSLFSNKRIVEISRGRIEDARLVPEGYSYDKQSDQKDYALSFDYNNHLVRRSDVSNGWQASIGERVLDKLSYQVQMTLDVADGPQTLQYVIADRGELKDYEIHNLGRASVEIPLGTYSTIVLERRIKNTKRRTTVWLAEALNWMPVKVEYVEKDGSLTTASLRKLVADGVTVEQRSPPTPSSSSSMSLRR